MATGCQRVDQQPYLYLKGQQTEALGLEPALSFKQRVLGKQPFSFIYVLSIAASILQWQSLVALTETVLPTMPEIFTTGP